MSSTAGTDPERAARVAWRAAFEEQLTKDTIRRVRRYAEKRGELLMRMGVLDEHRGPREMLHDAIKATLSGEVTWEPARVKLSTHLMGVVRWKTRHLEVRCARYRELSLDDSGDATSSDGHRIENEATILHLPPARAPLGAMREAARRVVEEIDDLAKGDADVIRILDAIKSGADDGTLLAMTRLSPERYRNARRRLSRITNRLTDDTRAAVTAALA